MVYDPEVNIVDEVRNTLSPYGLNVVPTSKHIGGRRGIIALEVSAVVDIKWNGSVIPKGTVSYVGAYTKETGMLGNKELSPEKLVESGVPYTKKSLMDIVSLSLKNLFPENSLKEQKLLPLLQVCMDEASKGLPSSRASVDYSADISNKDLSVISKDFGEILAALYMLGKLGGGNAYTVVFPNANQKLVDFNICAHGTVLQRISVKSGLGGPPSIQSIAEKVQRLKGNTKAINEIGADDDIINVLGIMTDPDIKGVPNKTLFVGSIVCPQAYKFVQDWLGLGELTLDSIEAKLNELYLKPWELEQTQTGKDAIVKDFSTKYAEFVSNNGGNTAKNAVGIVFNRSRKVRYGVITSPMGYNICKILNSNQKYTSVLNNIIHTLQVLQVYVDVTKSGLSFRTAVFSESDFEFECNATAVLPNNRGFSFRMK
jgi:hypothetical protein